MLSPVVAASLLALAAQISATPLGAGGIATRNLAFDDVIVLGEDGSSTIMKDYQYNQLKVRTEMGAQRAARAPVTAPSSSRRLARGCEESSEVQVLTDEKFLNWDVPLSSVVGAQGGASQVSITEGHSISNSLSVGASVTGSFLEQILSISYSIDYSETWESSSSLAYTFTVPDGQYGVIVSEPMVHRLTGNYLSGCTDSPTVEAFTSDSYGSQSYGELSWVSGVIRLCNSTQYPVPFCVGDGSHS
ncbi:hypothetical protein GQ53DRAFT_742448 [Thozetella sp. PMI_491]|nr:hypothetical protein GQ53DRAFT_742448 [Thozetella sp. PMI_491]